MDEFAENEFSNLREFSMPNSVPMLLIPLVSCSLPPRDSWDPRTRACPLSPVKLITFNPVLHSSSSMPPCSLVTRASLLFGHQTSSKSLFLPVWVAPQPNANWLLFSIAPLKLPLGGHEWPSRGQIVSVDPFSSQSTLLLSLRVTTTAISAPQWHRVIFPKYYDVQSHLWHFVFCRINTLDLHHPSHSCLLSCHSPTKMPCPSHTGMTTLCFLKI